MAIKANNPMTVQTQNLRIDTSFTGNRIEAVFMRTRAEGRAAMIFYVTAGQADALQNPGGDGLMPGDPELRATEAVIDALAEAGTDIVELGIPFSDPIADGPTIQAASKLALDAGVSTRQILALAARVRAKHPRLGLLLFTAYNPVFVFGEQAFISQAAAAGVDGVLIPDLPPEEAGALPGMARAAGLVTVFLAAPTTTLARAAKVAEASSGFIYYISLKGVTGARAEVPADLAERLAELKSVTDKPIAVGFGIGTPDQARAIAKLADGVVVGSELVKLVGREAAAGSAALAASVREYAQSMRAAVG